MPINKISSKSIDTKEATTAFLTTEDEDVIAKNIPLHINENVSFVYSIKFIGHWKNVLCDGMGSWKQTGKHKNTINVQEIKQDISNKLKDDIISCDNLKSIRRKFVNGKSPDLHRVVIRLEQADGTVFDKVFVQYYFDKEPHYFQPVPHRNSKKYESYERTTETTKTSIKSLINLQKKKPKAVFHEIVEEGGIEIAIGGAFIHRDRQQIKYFAKKSDQKNCDSIEDRMDIANSQENLKEKIVREVRCAPEFTGFMACERQVKEMQKYCTNAKNCSIMGVDTTFNIGAFYVTFTTYRNLMLTTKQGTDLF